MKKFTVITKDGSKWLSLPAPHGVDPIQWHSDNLDLPYIGSAKSGATLDESEVKEVRQGFCEYTMKWITEYDDDLPTYNQYRTAYIDVDPSHDNHISESKCVAGCVHFEGGEVKHHNTCPYYPDSFTRMHDYWKRRCLAAEKYIAKSPCDPDIYEEQMVAHRRWQSIVKKEPK